MKSGKIANSNVRFGRLSAGIILGAAALSSVVLSAINSLSEDSELPRLPFSDVLGAARLSELRYEYAARGGTVSPGMVERGKDALYTSPLSLDPFFFVAMRQFPTQESMGSAVAEPYLREMLTRNPRSRAAHLLLFRRAVAAQQINSALFHLDRLKELEPDMVGELMRAVGKQIQSTDAADAVAAALSRHVELIDGISEGVASGQAPPEVAARFASKLPREALIKGSAGTVLIDRLVRDGFISQARALWITANRVPPRESDELVYDSQFSKEASRAPFGWTYGINDSGVSEWTGPRAVYVEYYGRQSGALLTQTLALPSGRYRVIAEVSPEMGEIASMALQVSCIGGAPVLARTPMNARPPRGALQIEFQVPKSCPGQVLAIVGLPRESRAGGAITVHRISIDSSAAGK